MVIPFYGYFPPAKHLFTLLVHLIEHVDHHRVLLSRGFIERLPQPELGFERILRDRANKYLDGHSATDHAPLDFGEHIPK